jgi:16S rRNA (adenine1518-N6/adenine1519-N6)-dimethyltransferase
MPFMDENSYFERINEYKLLAKHDVGQNFLVDALSARRIVALANLNDQDRALEIGSGAGSLSFFIAQTPAQSDFIDIDEGLVVKLQQDFAGNARVHPQKGNIMRWDVSHYHKIIGNLPYYITSGILERILLNAQEVKIAVLMVQKEMLARLLAKRGEKDYGPLEILMEYRATINKEFLVPRTAFAPSPHVDSVVFTLSFDKTSNLMTAGHLYALTSTMFLHRRKTILNNLGGYMKSNAKALSLLKELRMDEKKRPEDLSLADYLAILSHLS